MSESTEIIICQGPPRCDFAGAEAVAAQEAGCPWCKRLTITEGGEEFEQEPGSA